MTKYLKIERLVETKITTIHLNIFKNSNNQK